jgi:uncharacterized membrane protein
MDTPSDSQGSNSAPTPAPAPTTAPEPVLHPDSTKVIMGILAYLGILVIVSYVVAKDDAFVKFHVKQGFALFIVEVIVWLASFALSFAWSVAGFPFSIIFDLVDLVVFILAIIGIINVLQGREKELPIVGKWATTLKI